MRRYLRLLWVGLLLAPAYLLVQARPVRDLYHTWDKLAHVAAFVVVYGLLWWALRWRTVPLVLLCLLLGGAVEVHQFFLPGFTPSWLDWLADGVGVLVGVAVVGGLGGLDSRLRGNDSVGQGVSVSNVVDGAVGLLPAEQFRAAVAALPLVSVDWVLTNPAGEVLVGHRLNAPARGSWFTPGGRIRKGEPLATAMQRVALEELGLPASVSQSLLKRTTLMGAWDHFFPDAAFSPTVPTQYVNLPHWVALSADEVARLRLPVGEQHGHWRWMPLAEAASEVHALVKPYVAWLQARQA